MFLLEAIRLDGRAVGVRDAAGDRAIVALLVIAHRDQVIALAHVDAHGITLVQLAIDDQAGHVVHDLALDQALEGAGTVDRIKAVEGQRLDGSTGERILC